MNESHLMNTYQRKPVAFERGEGAYLYTSTNEQYLDAISGLAVCGLGHCHPAITKAITDQASKLIHSSNIYRSELQTKLAQKLCMISGLDAAFFCNSGAEANEAAIKLARLYGKQNGIKHPTIVVMQNSFHGRTLATLTATGNRKVQAGFEPLVPGFVRAPFNNIKEVKTIIANQPNIVAILVEPIQGEGGVNVPDVGYLKTLRQLCDEHAILLMLDEIQTGMGRTGKWFAYMWENILPDVVTVAKGLANGVPIGACLAKQNVANCFVPGSHGSTFGGNFLACRAALATLETIESEKLIDNTKKQGEYLLKGFTKQLQKTPIVQSVRGRGLMLGIELAHSCKEIADIALQKKVLINVTSNNVIRLLPPFIITKQQADQIIHTVVDAICEFAAKADRSVA